jgi:cytochrome c biogenesis protein ResB
MGEINNSQNSADEINQFPVVPRYHPANRLVRSIYDFLASARLAMALLVSILISCLCGATLYGAQQAAEKIFGTLWFNGLLVLLVVNTACCFFGRMWGRRVTVISFGMILFHLSFVAMFLAIVGNSLFYFDGVLRLTEGETLSNRDPKSYDTVRHGLLFNFSRMKNETSLLKVHRGYKVDGEEKNIAYDIEMAERGATAKRGTIYINNKYVYDDVEYFRDREGYSVLIILNDQRGNELFGAHFPLQSFKQKDDSHVYSSGTMAGPGTFSFPPDDRGKPLLSLQIEYSPDSRKDRDGRVRFQVWPAAMKGGEHRITSQAGASPHGANSTLAARSPAANAAMESTGEHAMNSQNHEAAGGSTDKHAQKLLGEGTTQIGEKFVFGEYQLSVPEVRYWVAMNVRYHPGKPYVLASLCCGLAGIIITTIGRIIRGRR